MSGRAAARILPSAAALLAVVGCGAGGGDIDTAAPPSAPATSEVPTTPDAGRGCRAGDGEVPAGASSAPTADLDGDGGPDTLWLARLGAERVVGVTTSAGGTLSIVFHSAAPQQATALGQRLGDPDLGIVLLDTGRSVQLYAVAACALTPVLNEDGDIYTFDLGFTGFGTGVGCVDLGSGVQLVGLLAEPNDDGTFTVTRTAIEIDASGSRARNGETQVVAEGVGRDDPAVRTAQSVSCGEATPNVTEPRQS